jgi:hypothetical protein
MHDDIKRWRRLCETIEHDGDRYFDLQTSDVAETRNRKSRVTLTYMSPADFLKMAEAGTDAYKTERVAAYLQQGEKFSSLPFLSFVHDGKGHAKVTAHEGRHRARALQALGVQQMPVLLRSLGTERGQSIRWGSQDDEFDRVEVMPTVLHGQDGGSIPMPRSVVFR